MIAEWDDLINTNHHVSIFFFDGCVNGYIS